MTRNKVLLMALAILAVVHFARNAMGGTTNPPPQSDCSCCSADWSKVGTYDPPTCGKTNPPPVGDKSPIRIYVGTTDITGSGTCVEKNPPNILVLTAVGGDDVDVCYESSQDQCPYYCSYSVGSTITWTADRGSVDLNDPRRFRIPLNESGTFSVSVTSHEGSGNCNAGSESRSASAQVTVYEISGIYPTDTNQVARGSGQTWSVVVDPLPYNVTWRSSVTAATGSGLSWGGEHCTEYTLTADVVTTCPYTNSPITRGFARIVDVVKGRTFNCSATNSPKRYPVPSSYQGASTLAQDACVGDVTHLGETWDWPWPSGSNEGTSMSLNITVKEISDNGPNHRWFYIQEMGNVFFFADTNTNLSFTDSTTTYYSNHSTQTATLHAETQTHEERHYANIAEAESVMDGQNNRPQDMYDACEGIVAQSEIGVRNAAAGVLQAGIDWVDTTSLGYDADEQVDGYCAGCDYTKFFCDPAQHSCWPGIPGDDCP